MRDRTHSSDKGVDGGRSLECNILEDCDMSEEHIESETVLYIRDPMLLDNQRFTRTHTATELERLGSVIVDVMNARDFSFKSRDSAEFRSRVAPTWEAFFDNYPHSLNFSQQTRVWQQAVEACPNVEFRLVNISAAVHRNGRKARVFLHLELRGYDNVQLQGMCEWKWEVVEGKWLTTGFTAFRGPFDPENIGDPGFT